MVRHGPGVHDRSGPVGVAPVVFHLPRAVGVHVEEQARVGVGEVGVLPACVQHPAVAQHRRAPVMVLVKAEPARARAVGVHDAQVGHAVASGHAGDALVAGGGPVNDAPVGQVTGVVVVHVRLVARGHLAQSGTVRADFPYLRAAMGARHREKQPFPVKVQIHIPDEDVLFGFEQGLQGGVAAARGKQGDFIVVLVQRQRAVALPVLGQAQRGVVRLALDHEYLPESVQQRIGQQRLLFQRLQPFFRRGIAGRGGKLLFKPGNLFQPARPVRIFPGMRRRQILHRKAQRRDVRRLFFGGRKNGHQKRGHAPQECGQKQQAHHADQNGTEGQDTFHWRAPACLSHPVPLPRPA